jgi:hypothetical protein
MTHQQPPPDPQTVTARLPDGRRIIADLDPETDDDHCAAPCATPASPTDHEHRGIPARTNPRLYATLDMHGPRGPHLMVSVPAPAIRPGPRGRAQQPCMTPLHPGTSPAPRPAWTTPVRPPPAAPPPESP